MLLPSEYKALRVFLKGKTLASEVFEKLRLQGFLTSREIPSDLDKVPEEYVPEITQKGLDAMEEFRYCSIRPVRRANVAIVISAAALAVSVVKLLNGF